MTTRRFPLRVPCDDRGQVTAFVIGMFLALWLFAGLVVDPGLALAGKVRALDTAQEAARTGAQEINIAHLRDDGRLSLDPGRAKRAAAAYVAATGDTGTVRVHEDEVTVTVTHRQPAQVWKLVGVTELVTKAIATSRLERGITAPEPQPIRSRS